MFAPQPESAPQVPEQVASASGDPPAGSAAPFASPAASIEPPGSRSLPTAPGPSASAARESTLPTTASDPPLPASYSPYVPTPAPPDPAPPADLPEERRPKRSQQVLAEIGTQIQPLLMTRLVPSPTVTFEVTWGAHILCGCFLRWVSKYASRTNRVIQAANGATICLLRDYVNKEPHHLNRLENILQSQQRRPRSALQLTHLQQLETEEQADALRVRSDAALVQRNEALENELARRDALLENERLDAALARQLEEEEKAWKLEEKEHAERRRLAEKAAMEEIERQVADREAEARERQAFQQEAETRRREEINRVRGSAYSPGGLGLSGGVADMAETTSPVNEPISELQAFIHTGANMEAIADYISNIHVGHDARTRANLREANKKSRRLNGPQNDSEGGSTRGSEDEPDGEEPETAEPSRGSGSGLFSLTKKVPLPSDARSLTRRVHQEMQLLEKSRDDNAPDCFEHMWNRALCFKQLLQQIKPEEMHKLQNTNDLGSVLAVNPHLSQVQTFLHNWGSYLIDYVIDEEDEFIDHLQVLQTLSIKLPNTRGKEDQFTKKSCKSRYPTEVTDLTDLSLADRRALVTRLKEYGEQANAKFVLQIFNHKLDPTGANPHAPAVNDDSTRKGRYETSVKDMKTAAHNRTAKENNFPPVPAALSSRTKSDVGKAWADYRPKLAHYLRSHIRNGVEIQEFLLLLHKQLLDSKDGKSPAPPGLYSVMEKVKENYREPVHPLHRYFPLMMDVMLCEMDVNFSAARPEDSIEYTAWNNCKQRAAADHDVVLVIQRVMDVYLKYLNSLKENRIVPLKEENLLEYTEQMQRVNDRILEVLLNDEANSQRGRALAMKYSNMMLERKYAYESFDDGDAGQKQAGIDYLPTSIARTKMSAYEQSSSEEWASNQQKQQPPATPKVPLSGYHPKDVELSRRDKDRWINDYKKRKSASIDPIEINALEEQLKDLQVRGNGKAPQTPRAPAPPPPAGALSNNQHAPPGQYNNQSRYDSNNGWRQVGPPAGNKGHPNGETWTDVVWKTHPSLNLCKESGVTHLRISWPRLDDMSRLNARMMAIVSQIKPKDADCRENSNEQGDACKVARVPPQVARDGTPRFDWLPHTCKGCFFRRCAQKGSAEESVGHASNYIFGNGNGAHSQNGCLATRRLICEGGAPAVAHLPMFKKDPVTPEEIKQIQSCLMVQPVGN